MLPAARLTDMHTCPLFTGVVPHIGGPIAGPGAPPPPPDPPAELAPDELELMMGGASEEDLARFRAEKAAKGKSK